MSFVQKTRRLYQCALCRLDTSSMDAAESPQGRGPLLPGKCPFCQQPLSGDALVTCTRCRTLYHPKCWAANFERCAIFGCTPQKAPDPEQPRPTAQPSTSPAFETRRSKTPPFGCMFMLLGAAIFAVGGSIFMAVVREWRRPSYPLRESPKQATVEPLPERELRPIFPKDPDVWTTQRLGRGSRIANESTIWAEKGQGFSLLMPVGWEFKAGVFFDELVTASIKTSRGEASIGVAVRQAPNFGKSDLWEMDDSGWSSALSEARIYPPRRPSILDSGKLLIDGRHAAWLVSGYKGSGSLRKDYLLIRGARLFVISCSTSSDLDFLRQQYEPFDRTARSFRFIDEQGSDDPK